MQGRQGDPKAYHRKCRITGDKRKDWKEVVRDDGRHIAILHGIKWKRKREELQRAETNN